MDQKREVLRKYHGLESFEQLFWYAVLFLMHQLNPRTVVQVSREAFIWLACQYLFFDNVQFV